MTALPGAGIPPCPDPVACPVAIGRFRELVGTSESTGDADARLGVARVPVTSWHRVYSAYDTFETPNPGVGNTRFAPFPDLATNTQVPTMYLAESFAGALLETVFHNVDVLSGASVVAHRDLHGRLHAQVLPPRELRLLDLRDGELRRLGVDRSGIVSSAAEHYPCTRAVAQLIHASDSGLDGIIWHSRQAELQGVPPTQVVMVFCDRVGTTRRSWTLAPTQDALGSLLDGVGLAVVNAIAVQLGVTLSGEEF